LALADARPALSGCAQSASLPHREPPNSVRYRLPPAGPIEVDASMAYTLNEFCADGRAILEAQPLAAALPQIADCLSRLLIDPDFVSETFSGDMPPGKRVLHHDPELDFYVLAHVQQGGKTGKPHSHGTS
jgi:hypothetical protein